MTVFNFTVSWILFVAAFALSVALSGGTFGSQCEAKFADSGDIAYCIDMLANSDMKLYEIESGGWKK